MYYYNNSWVVIQGSAVKIAVDGLGNPWIVNGQSEIYYYSDR